jgi:molybdopterin converting factor small subunit
MITIKLSFFASLQNDFKSEEVITLDEPIRLIQLFTSLKSKNGRLGDFYFLEGTNFKSDFILLINGRNMYAIDGLNSIIDKDCEISIFPLIGGGFPPEIYAF